MTVAGKSYDDRKEAGAAIIGICKEMKQVNTPVPIGEYLGMKMSVTFDSFSRKFTLNMKGNLSHAVEIGSDPSGNITRIGNAMENMSKQLEDAIAKLVNVEQQLETAKIEVDKPFPQEQELNDKLKRLAELNSLLDMDEKGEDAVDLDEDAPKPEPEKDAENQETETEVSQPEMQEAEQPQQAEDAHEAEADAKEPDIESDDMDSDADISADEEEPDMNKPEIKADSREERPSLIAKLNEKKEIVAFMERKTPDIQQKREAVI